MRALVVAALLGTAMAFASQAHARVEYVTKINTCNKVDTIGDGKRLYIQAGQNMRFEVWGHGLDIGNRVTVSSDDSDPGTVTARILRVHNGAENLTRGCRTLMGSVEVEVDSPIDTRYNLDRRLNFRLPSGSTSPLAIRIRQFATPVWTWQFVKQSPRDCLTKGVGSVVKDSQDTRIVITLPPGAATDTSNCTVEFNSQLRVWTSSVETDITAPASYSITGTPNYMSLVSGTNRISGMQQFQTYPRFNTNIAALRGISSSTTAVLRANAPNARRDSLTVVVNPPPQANAFTRGVVCRNAATGTTVNVNDLFECEIQLAQRPPASGQRISFELIDRACFASGSPAVSYSGASGLGTFVATQAGGTIQRIPLRATGGTRSSGGGCASETGVSHTLRFWVGERDTFSGPDYSSTTIRMRQLR